MVYAAEAVGGGVLIFEGHREGSQEGEGEVQSFVVPVPNGIQLETRRPTRQQPSDPAQDVRLLLKLPSPALMLCCFAYLAYPMKSAAQDARLMLKLPNPALMLCCFAFTCVWRWLSGVS